MLAPQHFKSDEYIKKQKQNISYRESFKRGFTILDMSILAKTI